MGMKLVVCSEHILLRGGARDELCLPLGATAMLAVHVVLAVFSLVMLGIASAFRGRCRLYCHRTGIFFSVILWLTPTGTKPSRVHSPAPLADPLRQPLRVFLAH